ncbi:condensation domain-containing protein, partial [Caldalkalibacillus mannanilyticus]|uniref:condensation domain-containing protein n=1 Tax=Caldalkalibacillus mannanilyticus TaxID=1418 RepID=UPI0004688E5B
HISIPVAEAREFYPLSSAQKRLYILQQMEGSELSYNMPDALVLKGDLDLERLEAVFQQLIQRHETLRTSFEMIDGEVKQRIHQKVDFSLEYIEVNEELETAIDGFIRVFDLEKPPLLRVGVTTLKTGLNLLVLDMHHIISDGFSMEILSAEFEALYSGQVELTPLRIQYKDYAVWQQAEMQSERLKKQEDYWLNIFSGELPTLELPTDYERPKVQSFEGNTLEFTVDSELTASVQKLAEKYEITLYMFYLAAYSVLLAKHSAQEDIVIGVPIAGRTHSDLEPLIGMFVNTLAIRNYPFAEKSFEEFLLEVKERALEAHENQEYPFEELVEKLDLKRDLSRNPLFDTMFDLQVEEEQNIQKNASLSVLPMYNDKVAKFDLLLNMSLERDEMKAEFQYCTKLFKKNRIDRLSKDLIMILSQICQEPQIQLKNIKVNEAKKKRENIVESVEFSF